MSYRDVYIAEQAMARSLDERQVEAQAIHRAQEDYRERGRWLVQQLGRSLQYIGNRLLDAGVWLEDRLVAPATSAQNQR